MAGERNSVKLQQYRVKSVCKRRAGLVAYSRKSYGLFY